MPNIHSNKQAPPPPSKARADPKHHLLAVTVRLGSCSQGRAQRAPEPSSAA